MLCLMKEDSLALVQFKQDDMADWAACWQDEVTQRGYNFIPPEDVDWLREQHIERFPFWVTAVNLETGEKLGSLRLSPDDIPDLAIWIYPAYRNKGWGGRAYRLALRYLYEQGYKAVYAGCLQHNVYSRRILEKCGFTRWAAGDEAETSVFNGREIIMEGFRCILRP